MRRPAGRLLLAAILLLPVAGARPAGAQDAPPPAGVILMIVDRVSFEEVMGVPEFRRLAAAGGAALMTTRTSGGDPAEAAYRAIGAGSLATSHGPVLPLAGALDEGGIEVCLFPGFPRPLVQPGPALALAEAKAGRRVCGGEEPGEGGSATGSPLIRPGRVLVYADAETLRLDVGAVPVPDGERAQARAEALRGAGRALEGLLARAANPVLVLVVTPVPSTEMVRAGDEVTGLILAEGDPTALLAAAGAPRALTSDTTRREGLVANVDVAPTILAAAGAEPPPEMAGQPIRTTASPAPFDLHRRHLEHRRIRLPVQMIELAVVAGLFAVGIPALVLLARRRSVPARMVAVLRLWIPVAIALPVPLAAGGLLPALSYAVVVPFLVLAVVGLAALAMWSRRRSAAGPFVTVGAVGLTLVLADLAAGAPGLGLPLLGGTMFEGVRFFGLPNAFIGLLLAGGVFVATLGPGWAGVGLLAGLGLVAGWPWLGANLGAAVTLFAAAGTWWALRVRPRVRILEVAVVGAGVAVGAWAVLAANRLLADAPTHLTRVGTGGGLVATALDRLGIGLEMLRSVPAGWVVVLGLPLILAAALARPGRVGEGLDLVGRAWRDAVVTLCVAGMVSYLANDTGVAAAGLTFLYSLTALADPAFLAAERAAEGGTAGRKDPPGPAPPASERALEGRP